MTIPKVFTFEIQIITPNDYFIQLLHSITSCDDSKSRYFWGTLLTTDYYFIKPLHVIIKKVNTFEMR